MICFNVLMIKEIQGYNGHMRNAQVMFQHVEKYDFKFTFY